MKKQTSYSKVISKSRYARYINEENRREDWTETADRWVAFFKGKLGDKVDGAVWDDLGNSIKDFDALPSMRSVMTAGPALERTNVAAYNCAYLPVDHPKAFDEAMYILLCGTGVGFSVEKAYTDRLPFVPEELEHNSEVIIVDDSKEGWCHALRKLIKGLYGGDIYKWDVSRVRPAGAPLKTFGGRASGPAPLVSLFEYTVAKFKTAQGRQLKSIECHDILCKIGEVVVVGGVRRSAMISLGDLSDYDHATAKTGAWWESHGERALSNNSAIYTEKPSIGAFMTEWLSIYNSHSGERGIINRAALKRQATRDGKRGVDVEYGTNPCAEIILRPYQFCNLSTVVVRPDDNLAELCRKIRLAAIMGTMQSTLTDFPYLRAIWSRNTAEERLLGVSMTGVFDNKILRGEDPEVPLEFALAELRKVAQLTNLKWAAILGINASVAVTAIKPEGTVSQLTQTSSGLHPGHAPFYTRRIRQDIKDPFTQFLIEQGTPYEPCVMKPDTTVVFSFPQKCHGFTRKSITAVQHLDLWLTYQRHYCDHKPSVTISVKDSEWMEVGAWVYKNFDECTGVSFLPDDGGTYKQAPYEEITEEEYLKQASSIPAIDWSEFVEYSDTVEGAQMLACTSGTCEI